MRKDEVRRDDANTDAAIVVDGVELSGNAGVVFIITLN